MPAFFCSKTSGMCQWHVVSGWSLWLVTVTSVTKTYYQAVTLLCQSQMIQSEIFFFGVVYLSQIAPLTLEWRFAI